MKKVAVILAGSGYLDGAEIRESVLSLLALDMQDACYDIFSLDAEQHHVVNHVTGEAVTETRNILAESARIARGDIQVLSKLQVTDYDALLLPGGFGVAKNFSSFAFDGHQANLHEEIKAVIQSFHTSKKPIGAVCIAPAIIALALAEQAATLTIGHDTDTASELEKLGATHQTCVTTCCVVDKTNKIVSSPAYMDNNARLKDVYTGINKLVTELLAFE